MALTLALFMFGLFGLPTTLSWHLPSPLPCPVADPSPTQPRAAIRHFTLLKSTQSATSVPPPSSPSSPASPLELLEGDVVEYRITDQQRQRGRISADDTRTLGLGVVNFEGRIHPLCKRAVDTNEFFYDEEQDALDEPASALVVRVLSQVWYSQRCIEDRKINPHGEEAEDVYIIEEALSEGCGPVNRF